MSYPLVKYLVYSTSISGTLLVDSAMTEEEVKQKINYYQSRHDSFNKKFPSLSLNGKMHYVKVKYQSDS
jgi:uncharacterized protein YueI